MDIDITILQKKQSANNIVAPLLEKTRGKAALFTPSTKSPSLLHVFKAKG